MTPPLPATFGVRVASPAGPPRRHAVEERRAALARVVAQHISAGARVESHTDFQAFVVNGRRPNHLLHLVLSLVTFGLWAIVWLLVSLIGGERRTALMVDEYGSVFVKRL
jgi:hypothetical protein